MSKSQKKITEFILSNYDKVAYIAATKLVSVTGISESNVVMFAIKLGYDGYPEFQHTLQDMVRTNLPPNQRIEQLTITIIGSSDIIEYVMNSDIEKIKYTLEHVNQTCFSNAVKAITNARIIYVIGVCSSLAIAQFISHNLMLIFDNVKFISGSNESNESNIFGQDISIGGDDVLFAVGFLLYSNRVINAVRFVHSRKARKVKAIALTDSKILPIVENSDYVFTAPSNMASYVDSLVATLSLVNAIIVSITREKQCEIKERFDSPDSIRDEYHLYAKR